MNEGVRPTRAVLDALGIDVPPIPVFLHMLEHPLIEKAQRVPEEVRAGAGERILTLTDRVWFKVKRARSRGACTELHMSEQAVMPLGHPWWIGAAGTRTSDSHHDFYAQLAHFATDSTTLLPTAWDAKRLFAEAAVLAAVVTRESVVAAVAEALRSSDVVVLRLSERDVRIRIRVLPDGEAYLAISFINTMEPEFVVTVLSSVPGVPPADWQPEPTSPLHLPLEPGEMIYSTILSTEIQRTLLAGNG